MRTANELLAVVAVLSLLGCEEKVDEQTAAEKPAAGEAAETTTVSTVPTAISVELIEPGAEPRRELRYDFSKAETQTFKMIMDMAMAIQVGAMNQPRTELPPVHMVMKVEPQEVTPDGSLRYRFDLTSTGLDESAGADPRMVEAMRAELKKTEGMSGWALVDARGFTKKADISVPAGAGAQLKDLVNRMKNQIEQMSAPLPEKPVGVGARWLVTQPVSNEMLKFSQKATYELKAIEGDVIEMHIDIAQEAPPQDIEAPGMGDASARLVALKSGGSGKTVVDLAELVPTSEISTSMSMEVEIRAQGQQQNMTTTIDIDMQILPQ